MKSLIRKIRENRDKNLIFGWTYKIVHFFGYFLIRIIPQKVYIRAIYKKSFGKRLNLKNPQTLNEKIQWKKVYDHNPFYTKCADKYAVREYVKEKIGEKYLIPLLYHTDKPEEIPFDKLKPPYIIKSNHWSGHTIIIRDKKDIKKDKIIKECKDWLNMNYYHIGKEWQYKNIPPKIIIEKLLVGDGKKIPNDYKFHCFNGKIKFIGVHVGRFGNHKLTYLNKLWKVLPFIWCVHYEGKPKYISDRSIEKPMKLNEMITITEKLSEDFDFIRVDLYEVKGKVYFGELTFHPGGGYSRFVPEKYDLIYGKKLKLKGFKKK